MTDAHKTISLAGVALLIAVATVAVVSFFVFNQIREAATARKHAYEVILAQTHCCMH
jgi:hypothetical protein